MKIKTYQTATLQEAFQKIKQEMGPNALILSQREVSRPGATPARFFEVSAATEDAITGESSAAPLVPPETIAGTYAMPRKASTGRGQANGTAAPPEKAAEAGETRPAEPVRVARPGRRETVFRGKAESREPEREESLRAEITDLKRMVYYLSQKTSLEREIPVSSPYFEIYQDMLASDIDPWLACKFVDEAEQIRSSREVDTPAGAVFRALENHVEVQRFPFDGKIRAVFYGPTGVGKTTTIAKLAARLALEQGRKVMLFTLDMYRIAALEQLRTYAEIIGIPCVPVKNPTMLKEELARGAAYDAILIDTTGRPPRDVEDMEPWRTVFRETPSIEKHLVVSAGARIADLIHCVERFEGFGTDCLCITKIDETLSLGHLVNLLARKKKPVSIITNGQNVPRDMIIPSGRLLAEAFVRGNMREGAA